MPLKSSTERDLLYLLALLLGTGTVRDIPKLPGTWPLRITRPLDTFSQEYQKIWQDIATVIHKVYFSTTKNLNKMKYVQWTRPPCCGCLWGNCPAHPFTNPALYVLPSSVCCLEIYYRCRWLSRAGCGCVRGNVSGLRVSKVSTCCCKLFLLLLLSLLLIAAVSVYNTDSGDSVVERRRRDDANILCN